MLKEQEHVSAGPTLPSVTGRGQVDSLSRLDGTEKGGDGRRGEKHHIAELTATISIGVSAVVVE